MLYRFNVQGTLMYYLTPLTSASPRICIASAMLRSPGSCSWYMLTSPLYMKVTSAHKSVKFAPGSTITGCCNGWSTWMWVKHISLKEKQLKKEDSIMKHYNTLHTLKSSLKYWLQAERTTRWARKLRPPADRVTSVRSSPSNNCGRDARRLLW